MATSDRYSLLIPEDLEDLVPHDWAGGPFLSPYRIGIYDITVTDGQRAAWGKHLDASHGTLSYEQVSVSSDEKEQIRKLQELMSYPMLQWRIAAAHGVHPSQVDEEFLNGLLEKEYADYVAEAKRLGFPVASPEQIEHDSKFTEEFFDHVLKTGAVPQKLGL